jgi:hypothetical protein
VDASNNPVNVETDLPEIFPQLSLSPDTPYLLFSETSEMVLTTVPVAAIGFPPYPRGVSTYDYDPDGSNIQVRIINADIRWTLINRGIKFNQPILPPARLDFAYSATLSNCSSASCLPVSLKGLLQRQDLIMLILL